MICAAVVDEEWPFVLLGLLAIRLQAAPLGFHERCLPILGIEFAVGVEPLRADDTLRAGRSGYWGTGLRWHVLLHRLLAARALDCRAFHSPAGLACRIRRRNRSRAFDADGGLLETICPHRTQAGIGNKFAALLVLGVPIHEGVFLRLPVEALELVG